MFKLAMWNDLGICSKRYAFGVKRSSLSHRANKFTAIHRHSLGGVNSRLRLRGVVCASLTFARWRNQSSAWYRTLYKCLLFLTVCLLRCATGQRGVRIAAGLGSTRNVTRQYLLRERLQREALLQGHLRVRTGA